MWIEDDVWKEYKMKIKEQEQTEERIIKLKLEVRDLAIDLQDCMQREHSGFSKKGRGYEV